MKAILGEYGKIVAAAIVIFIMIGCTSFFKGDYFTNAFDQLEENNPMNWASVTVKDIDGNVVKTEKVKKGGTCTIDYTPTTDTILVRMNGGSIDTSWDRNMTLTNIQDDQIFQEMQGWMIGTPNASDVVAVLDETGTMAIMGRGDTQNYRRTTSPWYSNRSDIKQVKVENGVTSIGWYLFYDCNSITNVSIADSVNEIGGYAFTKCSSLSTLKLPNNMSIIHTYAFQDCSSLKNVTWPEHVSSIHRAAFWGCTNLENAVISGNIDNEVFYGCSNLKSVTFTSNVSKIPEYAFTDCKKLTNITLPDSVTTIGKTAFYNCIELDLTVPDGVTSIGSNAFYRVPHISYNGSATGAPWGANSMN